MKTIYIRVKIELPDDANEGEVVNEMDYNFTFNGVPLETEIVELE